MSTESIEEKNTGLILKPDRVILLLESLWEALNLTHCIQLVNSGILK